MLLDAREVNVRYGRNHAVKTASVSLDHGEIVTVLGANGAGKSSLLKALLGTVRAEGKISFDGTDISGWAAPRRVKAGLVMVPEGRQIFVSLTVHENLLMGAWCRNDDLETETEAVYERFPNLAERRHMPASVLSGGEQQMLAISRALLARPKLMMLDEPSLGLSPHSGKTAVRSDTGPQPRRPGDHAGRTEHPDGPGDGAARIRARTGCDRVEGARKGSLERLQARRGVSRREIRPGEFVTRSRKGNRMKAHVRNALLGTGADGRRDDGRPRSRVRAERDRDRAELRQDRALFDDQQDDRGRRRYRDRGDQRRRRHQRQEGEDRQVRHRRRSQAGGGRGPQVRARRQGARRHRAVFLERGARRVRRRRARENRPDSQRVIRARPGRQVFLCVPPDRERVPPVPPRGADSQEAQRPQEIGGDHVRHRRRCVESGRPRDHEADLREGGREDHRPARVPFQGLRRRAAGLRAQGQAARLYRGRHHHPGCHPGFSRKSAGRASRRP